jgi:hypothetical protein
MFPGLVSTENVFHVDCKFKMATSLEHSPTLVPIVKVFNRSSFWNH